MTILEAFMFISVILFTVLLCFIGKIWFNGRKNRYLVIFLIMGLLCSFWTLFNGINVLLTQEQYERMYPFVMIIVCFLPQVMFLYALEFTNAKFKYKKVVTGISIALMLIELVFLLTNPLHHKLIKGYDGIRPLGGDLFWLHSIISYVPLLGAYAILLFHNIKNIKKSYSYIVISVALVVPLVLNILYTAQIFDLGFDITPLAFLLMFGVFAAHSIKFKLFNVSTAAYSNFFTTIADAILVLDNYGTVVEYNPAFVSLFGGLSLHKNESTVQVVLGLIDHCIADGKEALERVLLDAEVSQTELCTKQDGGTVKSYSVYKKDILEKGEKVGCIIIFSDVTEYRHLIQEANKRSEELVLLKNTAESHSKAKSVFLANMSHEIRTPLNAITGMVEIIKGTEQTDKNKEYLQKTIAASKHLLNIINDVLDMSKIEANKCELVPEQFCFAEMIENTTSIFLQRAAQKNQQLLCDIDANIPNNVIADKLRLSQVINNLLSNAIKFTGEDGTITFKARLKHQNHDNACLEFVVSDNGIGIDDEKQKLLFKAFVQADTGISKRFGGTGLGLAISKSLVGMMGGDIVLESKQNEGSTFTFWINVKVAEVQTDSQLQMQEEANFDFSGKRFLLVDDIDINREIVVAMFESTGAEIECAVNGHEACEIFFASPKSFDLIFMDIHMPVMDGYTATHQIRGSKDEWAKTVPIIAMTADAFRDDIEKCKNAGMDAHVSKPIEFPILFAKVAALLKNKQP